jgi:hypothetical protein
VFLNLCFSAIDPWTDLEELLATPEQPDAGREPSSPGGAAPMPPCPLADRGGEGASSNAPRAG